MSLFDNVSGEFLFHYRNMLLLLSNLNESPSHYTKELVDNAHDAGSPEVWVIREPGSLTVVDAGHGMVPFILDDDVGILRLYWEDIAARRADPDLDIREVISEISRRSLEWMAYNIGFSGKLPAPGQRIRGLRGIGAQGFRQYGIEAEWRTRPSRDLAMLYYAGDPAKIDNPPVFALKPPTKAQLETHAIEPELKEVPGPLVGLNGQILEHGTVVRITGLRPEVENAMRPHALVDFLHSKFGGDVRAGLKIYVVDRVTDEGRTSRGGITIPVPPVSYRGELIIDRELRLRGATNAPFRVEFYYDPTGRNLTPVYRRVGSERKPLTFLDEFKRKPWINGKLDGYADFPDLPEKDSPWDTNKEVPLEGPVRNQWQKAIWDLLPQIEAEMDRIDEDLRRQRQDAATKQVVEAAAAAMSELDYFRNLTYGGGPGSTRTTRGRKRRGEPTPPETRVLGTVLDHETNQGVKGVTIELWQLPTARRNTTDLLMQRETGKSGQVSFGNVMRDHGEGRYRLKMIIPEGMFPADTVQEHTFNLGPNQPGIRFIFRVVSGQPRVEGAPIRRFTIVYTDKLGESEPYSAEKLGTVGIIEINKEHSDYKTADEAGDKEFADTLVMVYISAALTEYGLRSHPADVQLTQSALLTARALRNMHPTNGRKRVAR